MKQNLVLILLISCSLAGCKKVDESITGFDHEGFFNVVFINPGDPSENKSSIDLYSPLNDSIWYEAYTSINGHGLGSYIIAGARVDKEYWLLAPNDDKIIILNADNLKIKSEISDLISPQCIEVGPSKVYIGSKEKPAMYTIDRSSHAVSEVSVPYSQISDIIYYDDDQNSKVFIACHDAQCRSLYVTEPDGSSVVDSLALRDAAPLEMMRNSWDGLIILCGSDEENVPWYINHDVLRTGVSIRSYPQSEDFNYSGLTCTQEFTDDPRYRGFYMLAKGIGNIPDFIKLHRDHGIVEEGISVIDVPNMWLDNINKYYISPVLNFYLIGNKNDGSPVAIRTFEFLMRNLVSEIPIRDDNAIMLF